MTSGSFERLRRGEASERTGSLVVIPVGAVEQHGPHLPVGTDIMLARAVAAAACERVPGSLLLELLNFGCSAHHRSFGATVSLPASVFVTVVAEAARCLCEDGFVPVFVNGHGGNRAPLGTALQTLLEWGHTAYAMTYFELVPEAVLAEFGDSANLGHACAMETSLVLHLWPELVAGELPGLSATGWYPDVSLYGSDAVVCHRPFATLSDNGVVGDPSLASAQAGSRIYAAAVDAVADRLTRIARTSSVHIEKE